MSTGVRRRVIARNVILSQSSEQAPQSLEVIARGPSPRGQIGRKTGVINEIERQKGPSDIMG